MSDARPKSSPDLDWVVLKRFDDGLEAEIAKNFLRDHGITVMLQGNSGASSILNRFDTVIDIRLVVPAREAERASEALEALTAPADAMIPEPPVSDASGWAGSPYRASRGRSHELAEDDEPAASKRRYRRAAFVLAFALPIGSGHFYARHNVAGALLGLGIVAYFAAGVARGDVALTLAAGALVLFDALLAVVAVKRFNEGRLLSHRQQVGIATVGLVAAMGAGVLMAGPVLAVDRAAVARPGR